MSTLGVFFTGLTVIAALALLAGIALIVRGVLLRRRGVGRGALVAGMVLIAVAVAGWLALGGAP